MNIILSCIVISCNLLLKFKFNSHIRISTRNDFCIVVTRYWLGFEPNFYQTTFKCASFSSSRIQHVPIVWVKVAKKKQKKTVTNLRGNSAHGVLKCSHVFEGVGGDNSVIVVTGQGKNSRVFATLRNSKTRLIVLLNGAAF